MSTIFEMPLVFASAQTLITEYREPDKEDFNWFVDLALPQQ
jgi:hypothetical protein